MKVAMLLCPSWDAEHPPASLALLSAALKREGHEAQILDLNHKMSLLGELIDPDFPRHVSPADPWTDPETIEKRIMPAYSGWLTAVADRLRDDGVRLVGFSIYSSNREMSLAVARLFKTRIPGLRVVFGGPSCFALDECVEHMAHDCVDACVLGEADLSFPRLVDAFERTGGLRSAPGVLLREDPSSWRDGAQVLENLDALPFADYEAYGAIDSYVGKILHTTRGCVRKCVYCADWREMSFRHMTGRRVFDEVVHQLKRHPAMRHFMFGDSVSNASIEELEAFCDLVIERDLAITWHAYAIVRPEMTPAFLEKLHRAGCRGLSYGVESGSWSVLKEMRKFVRPELNARVLADTKSAGIEPIVLWMVGFPTETETEFRESVDFIVKNAHGIGRLFVSLFSIYTMHGLRERYGIGEAGGDLFWSTKDGGNTFPVRLGRLRAMMEAATRSGIAVSYQGAFDLPGLEVYEKRVMKLYDSAGAA